MATITFTKGDPYLADHGDGIVVEVMDVQSYIDGEASVNLVFGSGATDTVIQEYLEDALRRRGLVR